MADIVSLAIKPTASDEVKDSVIGILKSYLKKAEAGEIRCIVVIAEFVDGSWINDMSSTLDFPIAIGRLEIAKQEWIAEELSTATEDK